MTRSSANLVMLGLTTVATLALAEILLRALLPAPPLVDVGGRRGADISVTAAPGDSREVSDLYLQTDKGLRLRPHATLTISNYPIGGRTVEISTDEKGMRRVRHTGARTDDTARLLLLGDSVTFGEGVSDHETFAQSLEGRRLGNGRTLHVLNAGVPGYGTLNELEMFVDIGEATRPDLVALVFYLNDAIPSPAIRVFSPPRVLADSYLVGRLYVVASRVAGRLAAPSPYMPEPSLVESWQREVLSDRKDPSRTLASKNLADWGVAWSDGVWTWFEPHFARFAALARERGAHPFLVVTPLEAQIDASALDDRPQRRIEEIAARLGLTVIDILPALRAASREPGEKLFLDHCHLSPRGHRIAADAIATGLAQLNPPNP